MWDDGEIPRSPGRRKKSLRPQFSHSGTNDDPDGIWFLEMIWEFLPDYINKGIAGGSTSDQEGTNQLIRLVSSVEEKATKKEVLR